MLVKPIKIEIPATDERLNPPKAPPIFLSNKTPSPQTPEELAETLARRDERTQYIGAARAPTHTVYDCDGDHAVER